MKALLLLTTSFAGNTSPIILSQYCSADTSTKTLCQNLKKVDISSYVFTPQTIFVSSSKSAFLKSEVYMGLMQKYSNYQEFLKALMMDKGNNFTVVGDDFNVPNSGQTLNYTINVLANDDNSTFSGFTTIYVNLELSDNSKINLSSLDGFFNKNDRSTYLNIFVDENDNKKTKDIKILTGLDKLCLDNHDSNWIKDKDLLFKNISYLSIGELKYPIFTHNNIEKYYQITVTAYSNDGDFKGGSSLNAYLHVVYKIHNMYQNVNHIFNASVGSNWSSTSRWRDPNNDKFNESIDMSNYITYAELEASNNNVYYAFKNKYKNFQINTSGYLEDWDNKYYNLNSPVDSTSNINADGFSINLQKYDEFGSLNNECWGSVDFTFKINQNIINYSWKCEIGVFNYKANYYYSTIYASINSFDFF